LPRELDTRSNGSRTACGGLYDGHLEASTAASGSTVSCATCRHDRPVEQYQQQSGKVGTPAALIDDVVAALTRAIEELTRPIDTIKHQAKTVTVGISRSDEDVIDRPLVQAVLSAGAGRDVLSYRTLKVLADLDPAVADVRGFTRYRIDGDTSRSSTAEGFPAICPAASSTARRCAAPSTVWPPSARCSSPSDEAMGGRWLSSPR
jgi:glutamine---fructose-6-phosphate transaminase (isomerizing)